jgi:hypothetical protein
VCEVNPIDNGHFNDVLCVPIISCNLLSMYQITHLGEGKTVEFSPHQVVTKDIKLKSEVFNKFLAYKALVEKQSRHQLQRLRIGNGGEYVNTNFTSHYTAKGIQMKHTAPFTPQQNGVDERKNNTLKEMDNCMIQYKV